MTDTPPLLVSQPDLGPEETSAVAAVLSSHWVGMGPQTEAFEQAVAAYLGARHVVATASCTAALHLALWSLDRDERDQVIVPSLTFAASVQAILMANYEPVFAEVDPATLNLDCNDVAQRITDRTRAILPVHLAGAPCDLKGLRALASPRKISLVEDAAHAFGSHYDGHRIGAQGEATCFSFSSNKNITCGEGGAIATDSDLLAARLRELRFLGISRDTWKRQNQRRTWDYDVCGRGFRYHMADINASIGLAQLRRIEAFAAKRREVAAAYDAALRDLPGLVAVHRHLERTIPNLYIVRVTGGRRDAVYRELRQKGILCGVHYRPNHQQPAFRDFAGPLPVTEQLADEVLSLPLHTKLEDADVARVLSDLRRVLESSPEVLPLNADQP